MTHATMPSAPAPPVLARDALRTPAMLHAVDGIEPETDTPRESATRAVSLDRAASAVAELLDALGRDVTSEHLVDTPRRVAESLAELLTPQPFDLTTFPNDEGYHDLVVVTDIPFHSLCEHHLLPFTGTASIGYLPSRRIAGLSKLARVLEHFARDLQVQERLTRQVADHLMRELQPRGVGVVLHAEHHCMSLRGVRSPGAVTTTSVFLGDLADDTALHTRFL